MPDLPESLALLPLKSCAGTPAVTDGMLKANTTAKHASKAIQTSYRRRMGMSGESTPARFFQVKLSILGLEPASSGGSRLQVLILSLGVPFFNEKESELASEMQSSTPYIQGNTSSRMPHALLS